MKGSSTKGGWLLDSDAWVPTYPAGGRERHWKIDSDDSGGFTITNLDAEPLTLEFQGEVPTEVQMANNLTIDFQGDNLLNAGACLYLNTHAVPLGGTACMPVIAGSPIVYALRISGGSAVRVKSIDISSSNTCRDLKQGRDPSAEVLIITPEYPSTCNLYVAAFAHSRIRAYTREKLRVQVACIAQHHWYQTKYVHDGIPVAKGGYDDLAALLQSSQYKVIVVHFLDEHIASILADYASDRRVILICHGPETIYRMLPNLARPYNSDELPALDTGERWARRDQFVRLFAQDPRMCWVFVSDWLLLASERLAETTFLNAHVIPNPIDPELFPYRPKLPENRKRILFLRRFDQCRYHSVDIAVQAILELSKRRVFQELSFTVIGDGTAYESLLAPLFSFQNVTFSQTFLPNEQIQDVHAEHGIMLIPSRHDSQGVTMGEAAASGLVPVGSRVAATPDFINEAISPTLADPEDPIALADIIERLVDDPAEFMRISENISHWMHELCGPENTVAREIALIREGLLEFDMKTAPAKIE